MCNFFSFVHDGKKIYYFSGDQRKNGVQMPDGNKVGGWDSHSSITCYYGLDDDGVNKFEYNPYTDRLELDGKAVCTWDEAEIRRQLSGFDWFPMAGDVQGMRGFLAELKAIQWMQPDGSLRDGEDGIRLYKMRDAAWDAARDAAWNAARDAARDAAWTVGVMYLCAGLEIGEKHIEDAQKRMDVWRHGYGVVCNVDGELYCYERA